jgi:ubiquinone biosynthesis protein
MFRFRKKEIKRLSVIVKAMARYGFESIVNRLHLRTKLPLMDRFFKRWRKAAPEASPAEGLRRMFEELGTTFIKLGQVLSLRKDILPGAFISELEKLREKVAPISLQVVKTQIQKELKKPAEELFSSFEDKPLAAASIAQVHSAQLFDGKDVVVKIQRPDIEESIRTDLEILRYMARLSDRYIPESRLYDPVGQVEELKKTILRELDFETEMRHAQRFRENFADSSDVSVPEIISELTNKRILTIEMIRGRNILELSNEEIDLRKDIAKKLIESYLKQIFTDGFFHADPHPGNIFVLDDGRLCFHDFGMMGYLSQEMRENLADWLLSFIEKDIDAIADLYLRIGIIGEDINRNIFKRDLGDFIEEYYNLPLKEFSFASIFEKSIRIGRAHGIKATSDMLLLGKAFMTVESIVRELDPDFNFVESMKPYAKSLIRNKLSPANIAKDGFKFLLDLQKVLKEVPKALEVMVQDVKSNKWELSLKHEKLEDLENHIDKSSNRLAFAIVIAGIIIGSSTIAQFDVGPKILGFSAFGIIGYTLAAFLGLRLIWAIIKSGRL